MFAGRFEPLDTLGTGGQGLVLRAWDGQHGRAVALKIRPVPTGVPRDVILSEARVLLAIPPHPNVAVVRSDFFDGDDHVLVMDFVDGPSLATRIIEAGDGVGLDPAEAVGLLAQVAEALDHLHALDPPVVHGDVKPANIVIRGLGKATPTAVLVDFGLAAVEGSSQRSAATVAYAAPELQRVGPTVAGDRYSLAASAHALLTGRPPMPGGDSDLAPAARAVLGRGLATAPGSRFKSAGAFVRALAGAVEVQLERRQPVSGYRLPRTRRALIVTASAVTLVVGVSALATRSPNSDPGLTTTAATTQTSALTASASTSTSPVASPPSSRPTTPRAPVAAAGASSLGRLVALLPDGRTEVRSVLENGQTAIQRSQDGQAEFWTHAARITDGAVLLYRADDGYNRTAVVDGRGTVSAGRSHGVTSAGWSHVVGLNDGVVLFYRRSDGFARTMRFGAEQRLIDDDSHQQWRDSEAGFESVVHAGDNNALFYDRSGRAHLVAVTPGGALQSLARLALRPGYTVLAPTATRLVLAVRDDGTADVLRPSDAHSPETDIIIRTVKLPTGPWRTATRFGPGAILQAPDTGKAVYVAVTESGELSSTVDLSALPSSLIVAVD